MNSAQLLLLSGIGPKSHLEGLKIPLVQDLPVGENLQDHYGTCGLTFTVEEPVTAIQKRYETIESILQYSTYGDGPFTLLGGVEGLAWIPTKYVNDTDYPDIQFHLVSGSPASDDGRKVRKGHGISNKMWQQVWEPLVGKESWSIIPMILRPKSRGTIRLKSKNPFEHPIINAGYFTHPDDMKVLVEGVKTALAMTDTKALKKFRSKVWFNNKFPGCKDTEYWTDEYWQCVSRQCTATIYHYSGELHTQLHAPVDSRTTSILKMH